MRIKELRDKYNTKQKDLARVLGVGDNTISQYETGRREPDIATLIKIADFFNVSTDYLLGHDESSMKTAKVNEAHLNHEPNAQLPNEVLDVAAKYAVAPEGMLTDKLRKLREQRKLTQTEMATILNLTRQAYNHYETGKRIPNGETLSKIADCFDVTSDYLLGREENKRNVAKANEAHLNIVPNTQLLNDTLEVAAKFAIAPESIQISIRKLLDI